MKKIERTKKSLSLTTETMRSLTHAELAKVGGGADLLARPPITWSCAEQTKLGFQVSL